jgi:predicted AAA+ superfamily ATPase
LSLSGRFGLWFCWMNTSRSQTILFWFLKKLHYFR